MLQTLTTPRGETLSGTPWQVYPRPQMRRDSYINLNGEWDFAVSREEPETFDMRILVPFCPESRLSGIGRHFEEGAPLWYRRRFLLPEGFRRERVHISYLERGERIPSMESFINIANALNVSADELLANNLLVTGSNMNSEEQNILFDCSVNERQILLENMRKLKDILRSYHISK